MLRQKSKLRNWFQEFVLRRQHCDFIYFCPTATGERNRFFLMCTSFEFLLGGFTPIDALNVLVRNITTSRVSMSVFRTQDIVAPLNFNSKPEVTESFSSCLSQC